MTARRVIWDARPVANLEGDVVAMPTKHFVSGLGLPVRPDHLYRLTAFYNNPTGATIAAGGMGALGGILLPARGATWPSAARGDAEYQRDARVTWRLDAQPADGHEHHHH